MKDLTDHIRDLIARHSRSPETARTIRAITTTGGLETDSANCARDFGDQPSDAEAASWNEDALFTYCERLAIAADLGMAVTAGSEAEQLARREARRVAAGVPADFPVSRDGDLIDEVLAAFAPMQLTFLSSEPRLPEGPTA